MYIDVMLDGIYQCQVMYHPKHGIINNRAIRQTIEQRHPTLRGTGYKWEFTNQRICC